MAARGSASLSYDEANRLTGTIVGSTTASYAYDVNRVLPVLLEDGIRRYVWGLGLAYEAGARSPKGVSNPGGMCEDCTDWFRARRAERAVFRRC
jgi:hypothetical protein